MDDRIPDQPKKPWYRSPQKIVFAVLVLIGLFAAAANYMSTLKLRGTYGYENPLSLANLTSILVVIVLLMAGVGVGMLSGRWISGKIRFVLGTLLFVVSYAMVTRTTGNSQNLAFFLYLVSAIFVIGGMYKMMTPFFFNMKGSRGLWAAGYLILGLVAVVYLLMAWASSASQGG